MSTPGCWPARSRSDSTSAAYNARNRRLHISPQPVRLAMGSPSAILFLSMRSRPLCLALICSATLFCASAAFSPDARLLPASLQQQAELQQAWLKSRLDNNLPALMRKHGVAMWIVACREYAEDPAFFSLVSPTVFAARRTTIYVFFDRGPNQGVERLALGGDSNGGLYTVYRDPGPKS